MTAFGIHRRRLSVAIVAVTLVGLAAVTSGARAHAANITFGTPVQLAGACGGEPSIDVDAAGHVYVSSPKGILAATASCEGVAQNTAGAATWASSNGGTTFSGKVTAGAANGGGDTDTTVDQSTGDIYLADLEAFASDICVSHDHGATWVAYPAAPSGSQSCTPTNSAAPSPTSNGVNQTGFEADREWLTIFGPTASYAHKDIYLTYHDFATGLPLQYRSQDGGAWVPQATGPAFTGDPTFSAAVANGTVMAKPVIGADGTIYALVTTQAPGNGPLNALWLIKSTDHGATWTDKNILTAATTAQLGLVFNDLAIDGAGNLYALTLGNTSQAVPPVHALLFVSTDHGATWSTARDIGPADGHGLTLAAMHGGPLSGQLVIGWYHSTFSADPGVITSNAWEYQALESTAATDPVPAFTTTVLGVTSFDATTNPNSAVHQGQVCVQGLNCTVGQVTGGGAGNRNLADFSSVTVDPSGCAIFTYADDGSIKPDQTNYNASRVSNNVARQTGGCFSLLATNTPETPVTVGLVFIGAAAAAAWGLARRRRHTALAE